MFLKPRYILQSFNELDMFIAYDEDHYYLESINPDEEKARYPHTDIGLTDCVQDVICMITISDKIKDKLI